MATDMIEPVAEQAVSDITDVCCSGCKKVLPRTAFSKNSARKNGVFIQCCVFCVI